MMKKVMAAVCVVGGMTLGAACASSLVQAEPPRQVVDRLLRLYQDDRPRFVRHIQEMEQGGDCDYVASVKAEAEQMEFKGDVPKEHDRDLKVVMMEIQEAEKRCRE